MRTEKQIQASRANGARSRGPATPEGKRSSSRNSTRHGLLASSVVLEEEADERFHALLHSYIEEHQPYTSTQMSLVEDMAVARWRRLRVWCFQKVALDREMARLDRALGPAPLRGLLAMRADSSCSADLLLRYETAFDHQFSRALIRLQALQADQPRPETPYFPDDAGSTSTFRDPKDSGPGDPGPESQQQTPPETPITERTQDPAEPPQSYRSNASSSPTTVPVSASLPAGSSSTECAGRQKEILPFTILGLIFLTFSFLVRKITSIANFIPNVCTPSHGEIHSPSPASSPLCFSSPVRRFALVSAMSALSASIVPLVVLVTLSLVKSPA